MQICYKSPELVTFGLTFDCQWSWLSLNFKSCQPWLCNCYAHWTASGLFIQNAAGFCDWITVLLNFSSNFFFPKNFSVNQWSDYFYWIQNLGSQTQEITDIIEWFFHPPKPRRPQNERKTQNLIKLESKHHAFKVTKAKKWRNSKRIW